MKYSEIVEKVRNHEYLSITDITGFQLIMLLRDKEVKDIVYFGNKFEVNFIPITYAFEPSILKEEELPRFRDGERLLERWIHCYDAKKPIYIQIENDYFEVILDLLESA